MDIALVELWCVCGRKDDVVLRSMLQCQLELGRLQLQPGQRTEMQVSAERFLTIKARGTSIQRVHAAGLVDTRKVLGT